MAKEMIIEKNVSINKNINEVFNFLKQTKNQDQFSVWNMKDPGMKKSHSGSDGTKGFIYFHMLIDFVECCILPVFIFALLRLTIYCSTHSIKFL